MRRHVHLRFVLLAAALALGQWLSLAHSFEHPALRIDVACQICAHGQGLDGSALAPSLDRKSTRRTPVTNAHLVCRLLLEKKKTTKTQYKIAKLHTTSTHKTNNT